MTFGALELSIPALGESTPFVMVTTTPGIPPEDLQIHAKLAPFSWDRSGYIFESSIALFEGLTSSKLYNAALCCCNC